MMKVDDKDGKEILNFLSWYLHKLKRLQSMSKTEKEKL